MNAQPNLEDSRRDECPLKANILQFLPYEDKLKDKCQALVTEVAYLID